MCLHCVFKTSVSICNSNCEVRFLGPKGETAAEMHWQLDSGHGDDVCLSFTPTNRPHGPITGLGGTSSLTSLSEKTAVPPGIEPGSPSFKANVLINQPGYGGTVTLRTSKFNFVVPLNDIQSK
ncbi:Uncharacterised protein r2_g1678 [Pycnogonum litorale]